MYLLLRITLYGNFSYANEPLAMVRNTYYVISYYVTEIELGFIQPDLR